MNQVINVGIVGFGLSGRYFFSPYFDVSPHYRIVAVQTTQKDVLHQEYPEVQAVDQIDELLNNPLIDLVVVASPNPTHFDYARRALLAGKHVIVEKPFTCTSDEAQLLDEIAQQCGKVLAPFHNRRWDSDFLTIQSLISEGKLGEILEIESHFDRFRPLHDRVEWKNIPAPGSGVLFDLGPHLIDQALTLFGKPEGIYADLRIQRKHGKVIDYFDLQLYYRKLKVILKAGVFVKEGGPRFVLHGRKGSFVKYGLDMQEERLRSGLKPFDSLGADPPERYGILNIEQEGETIREALPTIPGNYMAYFDNVYEAMTQNIALKVQPSEAIQVIKVIETAYRSSEIKQWLPFY
jgi:scyllo-inositol 2-dehydrogenase (NADP+)